MPITTAAPITIDPATGVREIKPTLPATTRIFTNGRNAKGQFARWNAVRVAVTAQGHWYRSGDVADSLHNDTICRGCGHHGHYDYILDYERCTHPATAEDVVAALSGPARHVQPGDRVRVSVDDGGLEYGKLVGFYRDVDGVDLADVDLDSGGAYSQTIEHLAAA